MATAEELQVAAILQNRVWYGNGAVTWEDAPDSFDAMWCARVKVKRLRRKPQNQPRPEYQQLQLADVLAGCDEGHRCLNGACPECGRALQRWLTKRIVGLARNEKEGLVGAISIVPALQLSSTINGAALADVMTTIKEKIASTELVEWAVLCLDVSFNDFSQVAGNWPDGMAKSGWVPHIYGFIRAKDKDAFKAALPTLFPETLGVPEPFKTKRYDGTAYGASYALKWLFHRRVSYLDARTGTQNAEDYLLTAEQDIKLMRALSELGLAGRIALINVSTTYDSNEKKVDLVVNSTVDEAGNQ